MNKLLKSVAAAGLVMGLCACAPQPTKTADITIIQPLSQVEWVESTAANHAAKVSNNNLIMMR